MLNLSLQFDEAIDLFTKKNVAISEQVAENLTPTRGMCSDNAFCGVDCR